MWGPRLQYFQRREALQGVLSQALNLVLVQVPIQSTNGERKEIEMNERLLGFLLMYYQTPQDATYRTFRLVKMFNVPPWSAWMLLSCKNLKTRWDQAFWWKMVVQNDLKKCKAMFGSVLQMRQGCCSVEHARMQVGNAVGSQTPVKQTSINNSQSTVT